MDVTSNPEMPLSGVNAEHAHHAVPVQSARMRPLYGVSPSLSRLITWWSHILSTYQNMSFRDTPGLLTAGYQASESRAQQLLYPYSALTPERGISGLLVTSMPYKAQPEPCALIRAWITVSSYFTSDQDINKHKELYIKVHHLKILYNITWDKTSKCSQVFLRN